MRDTMSTTKTYATIEKEEVGLLHFPQDDVLFSVEDQAMRNLNLRRALALGNLDHQKVRICFQDIEGIKVVETTVWGVTDKEVILKRGTVIPIKRILDVRIV